MPLSLKLEVIDRDLADPKQIDLLRGTRTAVSVKITDVQGREVCFASGPLKDWLLTQASQYVAYWHPNCRDVRFHAGTSYAMTLTVGEASPDSAPLVIVPMMEGGGNELP